MFYSFACAILWATTGIFIKLLQSVPLTHLLWFRFVFAFGISVGIYFLGRSYLGQFTFLSTRGYGLASLMMAYYVCATAAFSLAPVSLVVLVIAATPVFSFILQFVHLRIFKLHQLVGFVITFAGIVVYVIVQKGSGHLLFSFETILGAIGALCAALVRAVYASLVWRQSSAKKNEKGASINSGASSHALNLNIKTMLIGTILCAPLCVPALLIDFDVDKYYTNISPVYLFSGLLALAGIATILPTLFNTLASTKIDPVMHNIICMLTPLLAGIFAWLLLDEKQNLWSVLAAVTVVVGIFISIRSPRVSE